MTTLNNPSSKRTVLVKPMALRLVLGCFTRAFYRVTVLSPDHVPSQGGALLVSNHLSFVDLLLIVASTRRFVRFLLPQDVCERWWLKPILRRLHAISLPPRVAAARTAPRPAPGPGRRPPG